jgi:flagellar biosynthesis protein FlhG
MHAFDGSAESWVDPYPVSSPVQVIAVTSGKGGVGKTNISVNLSVALAAAGRQVILMDADLGLANVDILLNLRAERNLAHVLAGRCGLDEVILPGPKGLSVVPASSGTRRMAELTPAENAGLVQAFSSLQQPLDTLVIDTAAGISDSVITFTRAAREVVVVVCDEPTSITDANAVIRVLRRDIGVARFHILANMVRDPEQGRDLFAKMAGIAMSEHDATLNFLGSVPFDDHLRDAVQQQRSVVEAYPNSPAAIAFRKLAKESARWPLPDGPQGHLEFFIERLIQRSANSGEV